MTANQPASRREVLAFIALQDLSMPNEVDLEFGGQDRHLGLELDRAVDVVPWAEVFALTYGQPRVSSFVSEDGAWDVAVTSAWGHWRGWRVRVEATEKTPHAPNAGLDEDTTAALREIAGGDQ
jgi:hypothetical protein